MYQSTAFEPLFISVLTLLLTDKLTYQSLTLQRYWLYECTADLYKSLSWLTNGWPDKGADCTFECVYVSISAAITADFKIMSL